MERGDAQHYGRARRACGLKNGRDRWSPRPARLSACTVTASCAALSERVSTELTQRTSTRVPRCWAGSDSAYALKSSTRAWRKGVKYGLTRTERQLGVAPATSDHAPVDCWPQSTNKEHRPRRPRSLSSCPARIQPLARAEVANQSAPMVTKRKSLKRGDMTAEAETMSVWDRSDVS